MYGCRKPQSSVLPIRSKYNVATKWSRIFAFLTICTTVVVFLTEVDLLAQESKTTFGEIKSVIAPSAVPVAPQAQLPNQLPPQSRASLASDQSDQIVNEIEAIRQQMGGGVAGQLTQLLDSNPDLIRSAQDDFKNELARLAGNAEQPVSPGAPTFDQELDRNPGSKLDNAPGNWTPNNKVPVPYWPHQNQAQSGGYRPYVTKPSLQVPVMPQPSGFVPAGLANPTQEYYPNVLPSPLNFPRAASLEAPPSVAVNPALGQARRPEFKPDAKSTMRAAAKQLEELAGQFELAGLFEEADEVRQQSSRFWQKARTVSAKPNQTEMGSVVVASEHLPVNAKLTADNLKIENWPVGVIPDEAFRTIHNVKGKVSATRLARGMPLLKSAIENECEETAFSQVQMEIPPGHRLVSVKVSSADAIQGILEPGDNVDVIAVPESGGVAETILTSVKVFSIEKFASRIGILVTEKQSDELARSSRFAEIKLAIVEGN